MRESEFDSRGAVRALYERDQRYSPGFDFVAILAMQTAI